MASQIDNRFIRFVVFASYGNDSCALIQWAHEWQLEGVAVVYSDTGWATKDWRQRVDEKEAWAQSLGFWTYRTTSIGFPDLAREKSGFPTQRYQWCSFRLKIEPGMKWLEEHDPHKSAVCLVGARRDEAKSPADSRAQFPEYLVRSDNHGGRLMLAPMAHWTSSDRDALLRRAGIEPLPHRSRECKCINSNRADMRLWTEDDIAEMRALESEIGKPIFRAARHMGANGIDEVVRWARGERGQYTPAEELQTAEEDLMGCQTGWCER